MYKGGKTKLRTQHFIQQKTGANLVRLICRVRDCIDGDQSNFRLAPDTCTNVHTYKADGTYFCQLIFESMIACTGVEHYHMGPQRENPVFDSLRTTNAQTSLCIRSC